MSQADLENIIDEFENDTQQNRYLSFQLGKEYYGIIINHVTEIISMQETTKVPNLPVSIIGVINLRGKIISVMDMRIKFNLDSKPYDNRTCIIVVNVNDLAIGLVVDSVNEVLNIAEEQVDPPPRTHTGNGSSYIAGLGKIGNQVRILLDIKKIVQTEEQARLGMIT